MIRLYAIGWVLLLTACGQNTHESVQPHTAAVTPKAPDPLAQYSDEDLQRAALKNINGQLPLDCNNVTPCTDEQLDADQRQIDTFRAWVKTVQNARIRAAYEQWADWAQEDVNDARMENRTRANADAETAYERQQETEQRRAALAAELMPQPPNP